MAIEGIREISDFTGVRQERAEAWKKGIATLFPNGAGMKAAGLAVLKRQLGGGDYAETDVKYSWFEKEQRMYRFTLGAASGTGTTITLTADNRTAAQLAAAGEAPNQQRYGASVLKKGDLLRIEQSGEVVRVSADPSSQTSIEVTRGWGDNGVAATSVTPGAGINPHITYIGSAYGEASKAPRSSTFSPRIRTNWIQTFRDAVAITRQSEMTETRTESARDQEMNEAMARFVIGCERNYWYGVAKGDGVGESSITAFNDSDNEGRVVTMDGVIPQIPSSNVLTPPSSDDGEVDLDWLEETMRTIFSGWGSSEKVCFCGSHFLKAISQAVRKGGEGQYDFKNNETEYGFSVRRLYTVNGNLVLMHHPLFDRSPTVFNADRTVNYLGDSSMGVVLDMKKVSHHYLKGGRSGGGVKTWMMQKALENESGEDVERHGLLTETSIMLQNTAAHWRITGLVGGKA